MRTKRTILAVAIALVLGWGLGADSEPVKIGFVDVEQVLSVVDSGKSAREQLERKKREAEAQLQPMIDQMEELQRELQAKQFVMSEEAVRAKQLDLVELRNRFENKAKEAEGELKIQQQRLIGPLVERLETVIKEVGRDNGFSLIMRMDSPSLVYAREALDITDLVIEKFNKKR